MAMFHAERLQEQERQETTEFGSLSVRVYFHHDSLSVEILSAKNVIPLDPNGERAGRGEKVVWEVRVRIWKFFFCFVYYDEFCSALGNTEEIPIWLRILSSTKSDNS